MHDIFHVSILRKYVHVSTYVLDHASLQIHEDFSYEEWLVQILNRKIQVFCNETCILMIKLLWNHYIEQEATWEHEGDMRDKYLDLDLFIWDTCNIKNEIILKREEL